MAIDAEILFTEMPGEGGDLGVMTLNRPAVLNALNHTMILALQEQLSLWAKAPHIKAVVIRAAPGRAFCAGGDIRHSYDCMLAHDPALQHFFYDEYQLNRYIFHYPKPYIALLDGITMGGGVGISIHGSHRVATERLMFAMPETGIGFYPDVGGTYFLPRISGAMGIYLGLTGARIGADDCVAFGLAQQKVPADGLNALLELLAATPLKGDANQAVTNIIAQFATPTEANSALLRERPFIDACFAATSMDEMMVNITAKATPFAQSCLDTLSQKSPTSLKVTLQALLEGKQRNFDACMQQEYRLTCHFIAGHDFPEGIRAVIIDKDQRPQWQPASLNAVSSDMVRAYFAPVTLELDILPI